MRSEKKIDKTGKRGIEVGMRNALPESSMAVREATLSFGEGKAALSVVVTYNEARTLMESWSHSVNSSLLLEASSGVLS